MVPYKFIQSAGFFGKVKEKIINLPKVIVKNDKVNELPSPIKISKHSVLQAGDMKIPIIGLGTWQGSPEAIKMAVECAGKVGYRHFDTAYVYKNECEIGTGLKTLFRKGLAREEFFISSKLPHFANHECLVTEYVMRSLQRLGLDYLDLYMIHFPVGITGNRECPEIDSSTCLPSLWQALEDEVYCGRIKNIGVSNFNIRQLQQILDNARIPPSNLQIEMHLYCQQRDLLSFCKCNNITVTAYAPLGSPILTVFLKKHKNIDNIKFLSPLSNSTIQDIAVKKNKTPAQILIRHLLQLGVAVIPKSTDPMRIIENFQVFDFFLSDEEMNKLKRMDKGNKGRLFHRNVWTGLEHHHEFPFPIQETNENPLIF